LQAIPHFAIDPIVAGAAMVSAIQQIASRNTDPLEAAVISVTKFHAGASYNVIPEGALIGGTMRSLTMEGLERLKNRFREVRCCCYHLNFL
jgi:metal-dependent amidase/aminoacylase/carboxypeptidase family protein